MQHIVMVSGLFNTISLIISLKDICCFLTCSRSNQNSFIIVLPTLIAPPLLFKVGDFYMAYILKANLIYLYPK